MNLLGNGLIVAKHFADALVVQEAELAMKRRLGASEGTILTVQSNLACTYQLFGRKVEALSLRRVVYSGYMKLFGSEKLETLIAAQNYAGNLVDLGRYAEVKALIRKTLPAARRVLGDCNDTTLRMRWNYALALYRNDGATLVDLREAVETLEETDRTARRVLGTAHPLASAIERDLRRSRAALGAREAPSATLPVAPAGRLDEPGGVWAIVYVSHREQKNEKVQQEITLRSEWHSRAA